LWYDNEDLSVGKLRVFSTLIANTFTVRGEARHARGAIEKKPQELSKDMIILRSSHARDERLAAARPPLQ